MTIISMRTALLQQQVDAADFAEALELKERIEKNVYHQWNAVSQDDPDAFRFYKQVALQQEARLDSLKQKKIELTRIERIVKDMQARGINAEVVRKVHLEVE